MLNVNQYLTTTTVTTKDAIFKFGFKSCHGYPVGLESSLPATLISQLPLCQALCTTLCLPKSRQAPPAPIIGLN